MPHHLVDGVAPQALGRGADVGRPELHVVHEDHVGHVLGQQAIRVLALPQRPRRPLTLEDAAELAPDLLHRVDQLGRRFHHVGGEELEHVDALGADHDGQRDAPADAGGDRDRRARSVHIHGHVRDPREQAVVGDAPHHPDARREERPCGRVAERREELGVLEIPEVGRRKHAAAVEQRLEDVAHRPSEALAHVHHRQAQRLVHGRGLVGARGDALEQVHQLGPGAEIARDARGNVLGGEPRFALALEAATERREPGGKTGVRRAHAGRRHGASALEVVGDFRQLAERAGRDRVDGCPRGAREVALTVALADDQRPELAAIGLEQRHLERGRVEPPARGRFWLIGSDLVPLEPAQRVEEVFDLRAISRRPSSAPRASTRCPRSARAARSGRLPSPARA